MVLYKIKHTNKQVWEVKVEADSREEALAKHLDVPENERKTIADVYESVIVDE